ncbi:MAG TPA: helix-turn-helix transcriptional regulator [Planktothrix sp.]|jgi:transcriptional regulator with XRE-family HTH domain
MTNKTIETEHLARHLLGALGETIAHRRQRMKMSQQELADRSKVDRAFISNVERGKRNPTFAALAKLAFGLGLRLSRLIAQAEQRFYDNPKGEPGRASAKHESAAGKTVRRTSQRD